MRFYSIEPLENRLFLSAAPAMGAEPKANAVPAIHAASTDDVLTLDPDKSRLASSGRNKYWALVPGFKAKFFGIDEDGGHVRLTITVTHQTKVVDGVKTRVVKELETTDGEVDEISFNYFAIHRDTKTVYYFGEDSSIIEDGKVVSTEGSWLSGVDGARFGIVMPGKVELGQHMDQELAPGVAEDEADVVDTGEKLRTKHFNFRHVIVTRETSKLEPGVEEFKSYAPGVGLVVDDFLTLTAYSGL